MTSDFRKWCQEQQDWHGALAEIVQIVARADDFPRVHEKESAVLRWFRRSGYDVDGMELEIRHVWDEYTEHLREVRWRKKGLPWPYKITDDFRIVPA